MKNTSTPRILVVDDDPGIRSLLCTVVKMEGLGCDSATDGAEALRKVRESRFDLIVLDLMMPTFNGYKVCEELSLMADRPAVLVMTALPLEAIEPMPGHVVHGIISKPFDVMTVTRLIRETATAVFHHAA